MLDKDAHEHVENAAWAVCFMKCIWVNIMFMAFLSQVIISERCIKAPLKEIINVSKQRNKENTSHEQQKNYSSVQLQLFPRIYSVEN